LNQIATQRGYSLEAKAEIIEHVIRELVKGERGVSRILREDEGMPCLYTWYLWLEDEEINRSIERAREIASTKLLEETLDIADAANADVYIVEDKDGTPRAKIDGEAIQRSKLRIYAREMLATKLAPKKFGPKVDVTSGNEPIKPAQLNDNRLQAIVGMVAERKAKAIEGQSDEG
jgi:hypothetical protein